MAYGAFDTPHKVLLQSPPKFPRRNRAGRLKHLLSAAAINSDDVDDFCQMADAFEIGPVSATAATGKTVALLFFQPSTRTRLGFEAATVALGEIDPNWKVDTWLITQVDAQAQEMVIANALDLNMLGTDQLVQTHQGRTADRLEDVVEDGHRRPPCALL